MNFLNNWSQAITLAPGVYSLALDLPDGDYRLTLADSATAATRWEIIDAAVTDGVADLIRGQEGTVEQDWPEGSVIYCSLTAGVLSDLLSRIVLLESEVSALDARVSALEPAPYQLTAASSGSNTGFEYPGYGDYGSLVPDTVVIDGISRSILVLRTTPVMLGVNIVLELDSAVTADIRVKIGGLMPSSQEWATLSFSDDTFVSLYVEFMSGMQSGTTYPVWIEQV